MSPRGERIESLAGFYKIGHHLCLEFLFSLHLPLLQQFTHAFERGNFFPDRLTVLQQTLVVFSDSVKLILHTVYKLRDLHQVIRLCRLHMFEVTVDIAKPSHLSVQLLIRLLQLCELASHLREGFGSLFGSLRIAQ